MGYCYTRSGKLCCDSCGNEGARKIKCPHGWCPAAALCPDCKKKHAHHLTAAAHTQCKESSERYHAELQLKADLMAAGHAVRCSAVGIDDDLVEVDFKRANGTEETWYMATATYHAIPIGTPATPGDYRQHGKLYAVPPQPATEDGGELVTAPEDAMDCNYCEHAINTGQRIYWTGTDEDARCYCSIECKDRGESSPAEDPAKWNFKAPLILNFTPRQPSEPAATFKGDPLPDPATVAQKLIVERDLQRKRYAEFQNSLMPDVPDDAGQLSLM